MKTIIYAMAFLCLLSCRQYSPQDKAEKLVKHLLDSIMYDPGSYQPVKFSKLDTVFTKYTDTREARLVDLTLDSLSILDSLTMIKLKESDIDIHRYTDAEFNRLYNDQRKYSKEKMDILDKEVIKEKHFKPKFNGWAFIHNYRGKNKFGALMPASTKFEFDKDVTKIVSVRNIDDKTE